MLVTYTPRELLHKLAIKWQDPFEGTRVQVEFTRNGYLYVASVRKVKCYIQVPTSADLYLDASDERGGPGPAPAFRAGPGPVTFVAASFVASSQLGRPRRPCQVGHSFDPVTASQDEDRTQWPRT